MIQKIPSPTGVVCHRVNGSRNVMVSGQVAMSPLKEVCPSSNGPGRAFLGPGNGGRVVARDPRAI